MIAKCLAVLAVVAQINASGCNCGLNSVVVPIVRSTPNVFVSSENSGFGSSAALNRNLLGQGKYPVVLANCGPAADNHIPITTSHATAALQEKPTVRLPATIPAPKVVSHSCTCYKTILRPSVHQQIITVPTVQRYIETLHKPVVENIQYEASPLNCGSSASGVQLFQTGSSSSGSLGLVSVSPVQAVQFPQIQSIQVPQIQTVQIQQQPSFGSCPCQC